MDFHRSVADRTFALLLLCYPRGFRRAFGEDMSSTFRDRLGEERDRGRLAAGVFWVRTVRDSIAFGVGQRLGRSPDRRPNRSSGPGRAWWNGIAGDLRFAVRMIRKSPGLSTIAVIALALGIGLTATTFSITYGTVLRGLPFENADALVHFERQATSQDLSSLAVTPHDYIAWQEQQSSFEGLGAYVEALIHLSDPDGYTERIWGVYIDPASFRLLRVTPTLGRLFTSEESQPGGPEVMVLSHRLWQDRFAGDSSVIGRTIRASGTPTTVIGVMPEGFGFPIAEKFWRPLRINLTRTTRGEGRLDVFGRLASGVSLAQAEAEFDVISNNLALAFPETNGQIRATLRSFADEYVGQEFSRLMYTMLAGGVLVLLIGCANVANVLIARAMTRKKEMAIRSAVGASRGQLVRQLLLESGLLATMGSAAGLVIASVGVSWFADGARAGVFRLPHGSDSLFWWNVELDYVSILFTLGVAVLTALVAGTVPAIYASRTATAEVLKDESRGTPSRRLAGMSKGLVVAEIALTASLLAAAGLTVKSVLNLADRQDLFRSDAVMTARIALPMAQVGISEAEYPDHAARLRFMRALLEELQGSPGVEHAAIATVLPTTPGTTAQLALEGEGHESGQTPPQVRVATVSQDFFTVFGVIPTEGQDFTALGQIGSDPVAVVNQSFAARYFPDDTPVHRRVRLGSDSDEPWVIIIGVVPDLLSAGDATRDLSRVFVPLAQSGTPDPTVRLGRWGLRYMSIAVRAQGDPTARAAAIRDAVMRVDPGIPAYALQSMPDVLAASSGRYRLYGRYYLSFGIAALVLALVGLYGVMAFSVGRRRAEFGIRMALGANAPSVMRGVLWQGAQQIGIGLALGAVVTIWLTRGLTDILFQVDRWDATVLVGVPAILIVTGLLACVLPAHRASAVDPAEAMRH